MNSINPATELFIKSITNLFSKQKPIDFKKTIQNAKSVLIYCPFAHTILSNKETKEALEKFFDRKRVQILDPNAPAADKQDTWNIFISYLNLDPNHLIKAMQSEQLKSILKQSYDYYLDISIHYQILNSYIGHKTKAPLKIGYNIKSSNLFNLNYQVKSTPDKQQRLLSVIHFLTVFSQAK